MPQAPDLDDISASLRLDASDLGTFLEVLAQKLEGDLPGLVRVRREGGLFRHVRPVQEITVSLGEWAFRPTARPGGRLEATRTPTVRGVSVKSETMEVRPWLAALLQALTTEASTSTAAAQALERLLR